MKNLLGGSKIENRTALVVGCLGGLLLVLSWIPEGSAITPQQVALAFLLTFCVVLADSFPIHIRYATKLSLMSVPMFLIAVLLPSSLAMISAVMGVIIADWLARKSRGLLPLDYLHDSGRWIIIIHAGSVIAHLAAGNVINNDLLTIAAAITMYLLDVVTFALFTSINVRESFLGLMRDSIVQTFDVEALQYLIGILGVLAYSHGSWLLLLLVIPTIITYMTFKNAKELNTSTRELLVTMADAVDLRDHYTGGHSRRVAELSGKILRQMGIQGIEADLIYTAARLHDIGKIGIPDAILLKQGPLSAEEWDVMRSHPSKGADLLRRYPDFSRGYEMVLYHHERWDGKGYLRGLKGTEIPFGARVIAVADSFDAITTDRPYRSGKTPREAARVLMEGRGSQWDKAVVDALLTALKDELDDPILEPVPALQG